MLSEQEDKALYQWYTQHSVLIEAKRLIEKENYEELEEYLHMTCLFPLARHSVLPDFMRNEDGTPIFPDSMNPKKDLDKWKDGIEVAWRMVEDKFQLTHDEIHRRIATHQKSDWEQFMESVEKREKERGK